MTQHHDLPELLQLESLIHANSDILSVKELMRCHTSTALYPLYSVSMGSESKDVPVIAFVGGIHGLERIGTQIILAFMETLIERSSWDETIQLYLERIRILFLPLVNPVGMHMHKRSNGNGVDLMRNAPIEADRPVLLAGGQRISSLLPWYRGEKGEPMEREAQALISCIEEELIGAPFSLVVDCHSGFGMYDRLWFPFACSQDQPIPHLPEVYELRKMLFNTYPNLNYVFEPQSQQYVTHGDLWDYMYARALKKGADFIPLTLELGSWLWVKKNPFQMRSPLGMFHPIRPHRIRRVLRHHQVLFEFFIRAVFSHRRWREVLDREENYSAALEAWYPRASADIRSNEHGFIESMLYYK